MRASTTLAVLGLVGALAATERPALAKTVAYRDEIRGFTCRIDDGFEQVPPQPGADDRHVVGVWKDPWPEWNRFSGDQPTFRIIWTVTPKADAPPREVERPAGTESLTPEQWAVMKKLQAAGATRTLASDVDQSLESQTRLFGPYAPLAERWQQPPTTTLTTLDGREVRILEVNRHDERPKDTEATWWLSEVPRPVRRRSWAAPAPQLGDQSSQTQGRPGVRKHTVAEPASNDRTQPHCASVR